MEHSLSKWAVIDIETTGIDPANDSIIDVGFLQFEGTTLVRKFSSLVQFDGTLSHFIQKLTGIDEKMVKRAPALETILPDIQELYGHHLIAHNADFEKKFLEKYFDEIEDETPRETYEDSLYYLPLLFPKESSLNLENFIIKLGLADAEMHRGFEDSVDLLKVMLLGTFIQKKNIEYDLVLTDLLKKYSLGENWFSKFYHLKIEELEAIASAIDFDMEKAFEIYLAKKEVNPTVALSARENVDHDFSGENVKKIFQDVDAIKKIYPEYQFRQSQLDMALRIGQSFKNGVHSYIQAPTGTGKTLAYLVPSLLYARSERKQVLVSTGTKTLQNQAWKKDLPQTFSFMGLDPRGMRVTKLVGSKNHLCELLFRQGLEGEDLFSSTDFENNFSNLYFDLLFYINSKEEYAEKLTREDVPYVLKRKIKKFSEKESEIAVDFRSCAGRKCPHFESCSYQQGLQEAKDASLILGNHSLTFSWPRGFPRPENVIVDEAHKIESEATQSFSIEIEQYGLEKVLNSLLHLNGVGSLFYLMAQKLDKEESEKAIIEIRDEILRSAEAFRDQIADLPQLTERYFKTLPRYTSQYWNETPFLDQMKNDPNGNSIVARFESLKFILGEVKKVLAPYEALWEMNDLVDENEIIALSKFELFNGLIDDYYSGLSFILGDKEEEYSYSLKFHEEHGFDLTAMPVNVGKIIHDRLLEPSKAVVFTSATLANENGKYGVKGFEWISGYLYADPARRFKTGSFLPPVYDYRNKSKVILCDDVPPMNHYTFVEKVLTPVKRLIRDIKGRSLLLFSSKKRFEEAREILLDEFDGEIPLFIQGLGNNVIEEFKKAGVGILLGMESFGEGIDIPGDALQFIFIDKIPDVRMDYVITERRDFFERHLGNEFSDYYLASRTRSLHQKLGRLLRTQNDYGGVLIVDSRIKSWKGRSIQTFNQLMEPYKIERSNLKDACEQISDFINKPNRLV